MKLNKILLSVALLGALGALCACDSCDMEPVLPPVVGPDYGKTVPEATMSVLDFKQQFWSADPNSCKQIGLDANGDSIILRGRVVSSDSAGNIYKSLVLRDETAALAFSINSSNLYKSYQYGQEIVVNVTGMYVGTYRSLFQVGGNGSTETTFGASELFAKQTVPAGWADPATVTPLTVTLDDLKTIKSSTEGLQEWQSQLVRIDGLTFENAGQQFAPTQNENRYLRDENGNRVNLRCSSYAKFAKDVIPSGTGSIIGILSYYGSTAANADWQVLLINANGLIGFDKVEGGDNNDDENKGSGSKEEPYTVSQAIANNSGTAWVKGYIVGTMNANNNYTMELAAPFTVGSNIYLADSATETETSKMLPVQLVSGTEIRTALSLMDNPGLLGQEIMIQGSLEKYFSQPGLKSPTAAVVDGKEIGTSTGDDTPGTGVECVLATEIIDGKYAFWSENKVGVAFQAGKNYDWLKVADCVASNGTLTTSEANLFTFTNHEGKGWTIADSNGQYIYMSGDYNSFQLSTQPDFNSDFVYWTVAVQSDGSCTIVNIANGKTIRYSTEHGSYGAYPDATTGVAFYLYKSK